ncbi:MAG TPA: PKD domain-containing protein, partial [Bacteroidia bacterium]
MDKNYKIKTTLRTLLAVLFVGLFGTASAQLSGTYSLDSTLATGGTNFKTWMSFRDTLVKYGVNGALTLNVVTDRVETVQISLPAITGASATNTITIKGNNKVLQAANSTDGLILFDGIDYLTIDGLIIRNTANSANVKCIRVQNGSDYNTITNCVFEFSTLTTTSTTSSAFISYSATSSSSTTTSATNLGSYNLISNNMFRTTNVNSPGPAFAIAVQGHSTNYTSTAQNNTITGNTIQNFYSMGIRIYNSNGFQVLNNDVSRANATSNNSNTTIYGIYAYNAYSATRAIKIDGNNVHDMPYVGATSAASPTTVYGLYSYNMYGNSTYRFSMSNNVIKKLRALTNMYSAYNYYSYFFDLIGNLADDNDVTVSTTSGPYNYGLYNGYTYSSFRFNSNTVQNCDGGYYFYALTTYYPQSPSGVTEMNDNLIQNNNNSYYYTYYIYSYYAQYSNATYPLQVRRNTVKNNSTNYYYMYCIDVEYYTTSIISDNVVENNYTTNYYYIYAIRSYYYGYTEILRNTIRNNYNSTTLGYVYGIYDYYNYKTIIASNLMYGNKGYYGFYGIYAYNYNTAVTGNIKRIYQNTIINDASSSTYTTFYHYMMYIYYNYDAGVQVVGNVIDCRNGYYAYVNYSYNSGNGYAGWVWDKNTYRVTNVGTQNWYTGSTFNSFAAWVAGGGSFIGSENYLVTDHNFTGTYASNKFVSQNNVPTQSFNTTDVYGLARNPSSSDRGAVEGFLDIAQTANTFTPNAPMCAGGFITPTVTFKNNFVEAVSNFKVGCTDNGVLKSVATLTSSIAVGATGDVTFAPLQFSQSGAHTVKFFLLNADDLPSNDTMTFTFNVLKAPGGATLSQNTSLSSPFAKYITTGKPDLTFPTEKMVYDLTAPGTLNYSNGDYNTKWIGSVTAKTINGFNANSTVSSSTSAPFRVTLDAPKAWEDSTIELSIKIVDLVTGCDTVYKRKVLIAPKAVPNAKLPSVFCEKSDLIFETTSTVSSGTIEYEWDFGDGTPTTTEASPSHNYPTFGPYVVTLKTTTNPHGFVTTKTFNINVTEVPVAAIINTNACEGTAIKLRNGTVYGGSGATTYTWDHGDGSPLVITSSAADRFKTYAVPGGYKVTLIASADGCTNTTSKVVYQFSRPLASFTKAKGDCLNTQFKFANNSSISLGQMGYLWDFDDAGNKATVKEPSYTFN